MTRGKKYQQALQQYCKCTWTTTRSTDHGERDGMNLKRNTNNCPLHSEDETRFGLPPEFP